MPEEVTPKRYADVVAAVSAKWKEAEEIEDDLRLFDERLTEKFKEDGGVELLESEDCPNSHSATALMRWTVNLVRSELELRKLTSRY